MNLLKAADYKIMPWKNGLGQTAEVAVFPKDASASDFSWRLSLASVGASGPFSSFPGIDRSIVQLTGPAMTLHHPSLQKSHALRLLEPYAFAGETATSATIAGSGTDFNVMVRRGSFQASVDVLTMAKGASRLVEAARETLFLYCVDGAMRVSARSVPAVLMGDPGDTFHIDDWETEKGGFSLTGEGRAILVRLKQA